MTEDGNGTGTAVDERVVAFLGTADRPRHLASEVAAALDLPRGRVRTGLQALADADRVVRVDADGAARWAVPHRVDEPDPPVDAEDDAPTTATGAEPDAARDPDATAPTDGDAGGPDADGATGGDPTTDAGTADGASPTGDAPVASPTDRPTTAAGPAGVSDSSGPSGSAGGTAGDGERRWRADPARVLALLAGLVVVLLALWRLRRR